MELNLEKARVLIVDDQPRNLDVLEAMLEPLDCTQVRATSPDEALLALLRNDFAAIVLDIRMPEMSGIELAQVIKQRKRSQHVPILALTAKAMKGDREKCLDAGASDYIAKPVNTEQLLSLLRVWLYR